MAIMLLSLGFIGCEQFDFNKEQYKNVVYLLSDNDEFNIYDRAIADLNTEQDTVFITVGVSGSVGTPEDIPVELTPYFIPNRVDATIFETLDKDRLFYQYNKSRFDIDFKNWTNFLPENNYSFLPENMDGTGTPGTVKLKATIPAGETKVSIPVIVKNLTSLSPDSLYLLDYKLTGAGSTEVNTNKQDILIPVYWKNNWTNSRKPLSYDMFGEQLQWRVNTKVPVANSERVITGSPIMYPLSKNEIRLAAGIESTDATSTRTRRQQIDDNSIVIIVNSDNTLDFRPYKNIKVEKVLDTDIFYDVNHTNRYYTEEKTTTSGIPKYYKTFALHYRYRTPTESAFFWKYCKLTLRYEYQPNAK